MNINKKIISYGILATIFNRNSGLKKLSDVYVPIVDSAIFLLAQKNIKAGLFKDINEELLNSYGIEMPIHLIKKIMAEISAKKKKDNRNKNVINVSSDSFQIIDSSFFNYLDSEQAYHSNQLQILDKEYRNYLKSVYGDEISLMAKDIVTFINEYSEYLSGYFSSSKMGSDMFMDSKNLQPLSFLKFVADNGLDYLHEIMKNIYLGSTISCIVTSDGEISKRNYGDLELLIDTSVLICLEDLNSSDAHNCVKTLMDYIRKCGIRTSVLKYTLEETFALLGRKANNSEPVQCSFIDDESIDNAISRKSLSPADILSIAGKYLYIKGKKSIDVCGNMIQIIENDEEYIENAKKSDRYISYKKSRMSSNPEGVLHDVACSLYVRNKRKNKKIDSIYDVKAWFVVHKRNKFKEIIDETSITGEVICDNDLLNLLWIENPSIIPEALKEISLINIMSTTVGKMFSEKKALKDIDKYITEKHKLGEKDLADKVYILRRHLAFTSYNKLIDSGNEKDRYNANKGVIEEILNEATEKEKSERKHFDEMIKPKDKQIIGLRLENISLSKDKIETLSISKEKLKESVRGRKDRKLAAKRKAQDNSNIKCIAFIIIPIIILVFDFVEAYLFFTEYWGIITIIFFVFGALAFVFKLVLESVAKSFYDNCFDIDFEKRKSRYEEKESCTQELIDAENEEIERIMNEIKSLENKIQELSCPTQ